MLYSIMSQLSSVTLGILLCWSYAQAGGVSNGANSVSSEQFGLNKDFHYSPKEEIIIIGRHTSELSRAQDSLAPFGISVSLDLQRDILKLTAMEPWSPKLRQTSVALKLLTHFPVELEGTTQHSLTLVSEGAQINNQWTSPSLTLIPSDSFDHGRHSYLISTGGRLEVQALTHTAGKFVNQGKILSPEHLDLTITDGTFENFGKIESNGLLRFKGGKIGQKPKFDNLGEITAPTIQVGSFYERFYSFQNRSNKKTLINAKKWVGSIQHLINSGEILISEEVSLSGFRLDNELGSLHSGGILSADFAQVNNTQSSISGQTRTEILVRETLTNGEGEIGSVSPTDLTLLGPVRAEKFGKIQGTDLIIRSNHRDPITLQAGELIADQSITIFSVAKILLPGVQIHAPQLHLAAPDFALDEQKDCDNTVVHCDPTRAFTLTSPYCTQGNVLFLQSCLKQGLSKPAATEDATDTSATSAAKHQEASTLSPTSYLKQRFSELKDEVGQMSAHFERGDGKFSTFKVSLRADLKSSKDVEFVAPLANLYFGDHEGGAALEAQSLRSYANFVFLMSGHVATRDATIYSPGGLRIGALQEDATAQVRVADQRFPLLCRNGAVWTTQNQTTLHGPLHCEGAMQIGGDLVVRSEKDQWSFSPDIQVQGDLVFEGSGQFNAIRHLGDSLHMTTSSLPSSDYSVSGKIQVDQAMISEKPMVMNLYSTDLWADEVKGDLSVKIKDANGKNEIQFPDQEPTRQFRPGVSIRKGGIVKLAGKNNQGVISAPQLFLIEEKGEFYLATKNPYFIKPKSPLQDLMRKGFESNATYITPDLRRAMQEAAGYRFHYSLRERFFFNPTEGERFYDQIKDHIVILQPGHGLVPLPEGQAVFSLSPGLLLERVKDLCQENLMRGYIYEDRPISLEFVAELHKNATEYLKTIGMSSNAQSSSPQEGDQNLLVALRNPTARIPLPQKPVIFYQKTLDEQGVEEFKPFLYLPPALLEKARAEQTGNAFANLLARFPEGTTAEEMVELLPEKSDTQKALVEFFKNNPKTKKAVTRAAERTLLTNSSIEDSLSLNFPIQAEHSAIITEGDLHLAINQRGKTAAFISKKGSIALASTKKRLQNGSNFDDQISDQRTLSYKGHLELRAGKDIKTQAVKIDVGSLQLDAQGNVYDSALMLESHSERKSPGVQEKKDRTQAQVSQFEVQGKLGIRAQNIALQGTHADAEAIQLEAKDKLAVLGVQESSSFSKRTEEKTGALFWAGEKIETHSESKIQFKAASLKAKGTVEIKTNEGILEAPKIEASETEIHAERLKIKQGKNKSASASTAKSESAWWVSIDSEEQKHETFTQAEFKGKTKLFVKELELEKVRDGTLKYLDQLEFDPAQTKVIYEILNEIHHRETKSISAPGPALIAAVAVISSVATGGVGGAAVAGIGGGLKGTITGTMISAAISSITAQVTTQVTLGILSQQSLDEIFKQITRPETFKNAAISAITAGALFEINKLQEAAKTSELLCKVQNAGVQAGVGLGADLLSGADLGNALKSAGIQFGAQAGSSVVAGKVGEHFAKKTDPTDRCLHKLAHGASAAAFAGAGAAALGKDIGTAATGAALGAMTAEIVAEALSAPLNKEVFEEVKKREAETGHALTKDQKIEITRSKVEDLTKIAKLSGAISGLVTGSAQGLSTAGSAANTAIDHNFLHVALPLLIAGYLIYEEVTTCVETDDAIVSDPLGEALLMPVAGKAAKLAKGTARISKEVVKDLASASKRLVSNEVGAIGEGVEDLTQAAARTEAASAGTGQVAGESAEHIRIRTPYEVAAQEMTREALAARKSVSEGATLYRKGTRNRSQTGGGAQFWSLEHPNNPGYGQRYGIPQENLNANDFIETATVRPGSEFITRPAPPSPDGLNPGGGIEVVVPESGVNIHSHTSL